MRDDLAALPELRLVGFPRMTPAFASNLEFFGELASQILHEGWRSRHPSRRRGVLQSDFQSFLGLDALRDIFLTAVFALPETVHPQTEELGPLRFSRVLWLDFVLVLL